MTKEVIKDVAYYIGLISTNKATTADKLELAKLLNNSAEEEKTKEMQTKLDEIKKFIESKGLTIKEVYEGLKDPLTPIFTWVDDNGNSHHRYEGEKGKYPSWVTEMKKKLTKEKAMEMAGNSEKGKVFIEKLYAS